MQNILELVTLKYYIDTTSGIKHNWEVYLAEHMIGHLHDCEGIGGNLGKFTETELFDDVCAMAQEELDALIGTEDIESTRVTMLTIATYDIVNYYVHGVKGMKDLLDKLECSWAYDRDILHIETNVIKYIIVNADDVSHLSDN